MEYCVYETLVTIEHEPKKHYGICCQNGKSLFVTGALITDQHLVEELAEEMTCGELDPIHLDDVLNDWIIGNSLSCFQLQ